MGLLCRGLNNGFGVYTMVKIRPGIVYARPLHYEVGARFAYPGLSLRRAAFSWKNEKPKRLKVYEFHGRYMVLDSRSSTAARRTEWELQNIRIAQEMLSICLLI